MQTSNLLIMALCYCLLLYSLCFCFSAYVLFIVDEGEINKMDQLWLEREMFNINRHCKVIYRTLTDVGTNGVLNDSKELTM